MLHALPAGIQARYDRWVEAEEAAHCPPLSFTEVRKGVQALSQIYVQTCREDRTERSAAGAGKRAAFGLYYAPLHFLTAYHALARLRPEGLPHRPILDLGCGSGALGAAISLHAGGAPVEATDLQPDLRPFVQRSLSAFELPGRFSRGTLPGSLGWPKKGEILSFGWSLNELPEDAREETLRRVESALRKGSLLIVFEPLAGPVTPWWAQVARRLAPLGIEDHLVKMELARPDFIARMDKAAGMDHRLVGARVLIGPGPGDLRTSPPVAPG